MNRFHLFFMFLSALVSSALHYSVNESENLKTEIHKVIYIHEAPLQDESLTKEKEIEKEAPGIADNDKGMLMLFNIRN